MNVQTGIINIRGKDYKSVALRVQEFRNDHPDWGLTADVVARDENCVVMKATVADENGRIVATGHAEEYRTSSQINRTSALENAETSAIGRALAAAGYGGTEFASANEVENAIHQQAAGGAAKGTQQESAVSPSPLKQQLEQSVEQGKAGKGWREADSPYSTPTKLHAAMNRLDHDLNGCSDSEMVYAVTSTSEWREFVRVSEKHSPHYLHGGDPAPEEFEGLIEKAARLVREFDSAEANHIADLARA